MTRAADAPGLFEKPQPATLRRLSDAERREVEYQQAVAELVITEAPADRAELLRRLLKMVEVENERG